MIVEPSEARGSWEEEARNWIAWARTPGHDVFPYYAPGFFDEILPPAQGLTLEIGCGEGRMVRALSSNGHTVVGIDASATLVRAARDAGAESAYLLADATDLPFADATFQTVVAYNSLQTMTMFADMARSVREAGRVLKPSGHLCVCVAHPMTDLDYIRQAAAKGDDSAGSYFENQKVNQTVTRNALEMTFRGWTYTLEDYVRALEDAGFAIERMREPRPRSAPERHQSETQRRFPLFLSVRARKLAS